MRFLIILALLFVTNDPIEIAKINKIKGEAAKFFAQGDYEAAASKYTILADSMGVQEDAIVLNRAHCYYNLNDTSKARFGYQQAMLSKDNKLKSIAAQQLGVMAKNEQKLEESLNFLKHALKSNPQNADAKYDYEVVKKLLEQQKQQQNQDQNQQNQDQQNQDQKNQDQKDQQNKDQQSQDQQKQDQQNEQDKQQNQDQQQQEKDGEKKEGEDQKEGEKSESEEQKQEDGEKSDEEKKKEMQEATRKKLQEMNISEEKAKMILEALKSNEIQYIQQRKRKASERPDSDKPDW